MRLKRKDGKKPLSLTIKLMYVLLISLLVVSFSMARYRTTYNAQISANLARWTFKVNEAEQEIFTINLANTADPSSKYDVSKKVIAPGAAGKIEIYIDCAESKVPIDYSIDISQNESTNIPNQIEFYILEDGEKKYIISESIVTPISITGTRDLEQIKNEPIKRVYIYWEWKYNKTINESEYEGKSFFINAIVTGKQHISE